MAQLQVKTLSGMMIYTGDSCNENAAALANRNYGFTTSTIGKLTKLATGSSNWSYYTSYIYNENATVINSITDIINETYSYISDTKLEQMNGDVYVYNDKFSLKYSYEYDLNSSLNLAKELPYEDIVTFTQAINESNYNKQQYYNGNSEVEAITFNGLNYMWQQYGSTIKDTYRDITYDFGGEYIKITTVNHPLTYSLNFENKTEKRTGLAYSTTEMNEDGTPKSYTYIYSYEYTEITEKLDENGENITYTAVEITNIEHMKDILKIKHDAHINKFITDMNIADEPLYAYYISKADTKYRLVFDSYTLNRQITDIYVNYDGEFNDWFDNKVTFSVDTVLLNSYRDVYGITAAEDYYFGTRYNEYEDLSHGNVKLNAGDSYVFSLNKSYIPQDTPISILSPYKAEEINFSPCTGALTYKLDFDYHYNMDINCDEVKDTTWHERRGIMLKKLIVGDLDITNEGIITYTPCNISEINGLSNLTTLEYLDISGCNVLEKTPNIKMLDKLKAFIAVGSNIDNFSPADGLTFDLIMLPDSIKTINMKDAKLTSNSSLYYTPSSKLINLTLDNVTGFDSYKLVEDWVKKLREDNIVDSGLVNYVKLTNVNWTAANVGIILDLHKLGLDELTGNIKLVGDTINKGKLTRAQYWAIIETYGQDTVKASSNSNLHFTYELVDGCYNAEFIIPVVSVENEETSVTKHTINLVLDDKITTNKFLDTLALTDIIFTKYNNAALTTTLTNSIAGNDTYYTTKLNAGDIVLYKGKELMIFFKNSPNIVNNYIKLGTIKPTELEAYKNIAENIDSAICSIKDSSVVYVSDIALGKVNIEMSLAENDPLQMLTLDIQVHPNNAYNKTLKFGYDTEYISNIDYSENRIGIVLTGKYGETVLTIGSSDNTNIVKTCNIKITNPNITE